MASQSEILNSVYDSSTGTLRITGAGTQRKTAIVSSEFLGANIYGQFVGSAVSSGTTGIGTTTISIPTENSVTLISDNTNWRII